MKFNIWKAALTYRMITIQDTIKGMKKSTESFWRKELRAKKKTYVYSLKQSKYWDNPMNWLAGIPEPIKPKNLTMKPKKKPGRKRKVDIEQ